MKEIKFRVWDNHTKKMSGPKGLKFSMRDGIIDRISCYMDNSGHSEWGSSEHPLNQERYKLMQYTGLHDDEWVEIYEGDLLEARYAPSYEPKVYEIRWNDDNASFVCYRKHENPQVDHVQLPLSPSNSMENLRVVGNIYETSKTKSI